MPVDILKLDSEELVTTFPIGSHLLGRGPSLQCNDKRVSRNHATIDVTPENIKLTSTHINPCFLKAAHSKTITILAKDHSKELDDGDAFAFLPDDFWFKIRVIKEVTEEIKTETETKETKRYSTDGEHEDAPPEKKIKIEEENNTSTTSETGNITINSDENSTNHQELEPKIAQENNDDNDPITTNLHTEQESHEEIIASEVNQSDETTVKNEEETNGKQEEKKKEADTTSATNANSDDDPGTSFPKPRKERCMYGVQCYRKNPLHRQDFTHPGDSDYESDPDDNRPTCSFGAQCYRKNKDHRRDFKHPPRQPPGKKKRNRKKVDRLNAANSQDMRELSDSESEDPFLADDDSDEYVRESEDADSDWEDSQEVDEDGDNVKRLVREAKRFAKK